MATGLTAAQHKVEGAKSQAGILQPAHTIPASFLLALLQHCTSLHQQSVHESHLHENI